MTYAVVKSTGEPFKSGESKGTKSKPTSAGSDDLISKKISEARFFQLEDACFKVEVMAERNLGA